LLANTFRYELWWIFHAMKEIEPRDLEVEIMKGFLRGYGMESRTPLRHEALKSGATSAGVYEQAYYSAFNRNSVV
jgi:hypothetical protein